MQRRTRPSWVFLSLLLVFAAFVVAASPRRPPPPDPRSRAGQRTSRIAVYDFAEVTLRQATRIPNCFTDAEITGTMLEGGRAIEVPGFCDAEDGTVFRVRFLPRSAGRHDYTVRLRVPSLAIDLARSGYFDAVGSGRKGLLRVDPDHPLHFVWEGTGEHVFQTGGTAYHLLSWTQEGTRQALLARMISAGANRIRFLNFGRASNDEWDEGMVQGTSFRWTVSPWKALQPTLQLDEGSIRPDHTRFELEHWRAAERLLATMRDSDVIAAVNMYMDRGAEPALGPDDTPPADSDLEDLYFRYAVARYGAFSNVVWDLGTEHDEYRSSSWARSMGSKVHAWDPYGHLVSAHPHNFRPEYLTQSWYDYVEFQYDASSPDGFGSDPVTRVNRQARAARDQVREVGRPIPIVNEEYGYELDPSGSTDPLPLVRRKAWAIAMAGAYFTSGEHKAWQHGDLTNGGREAPRTEILADGKRLREFFTSHGIPYWLMEPMTELDGTDAMGLAAPGRHYVVYLPYGGSVRFDLPPGFYSVESFDPASGASRLLAFIQGGSWQSPSVPDGADRVFHLRLVR